MDLSAYLDRARAAARAPSDYALAQQLGITRQHVSDMRRGLALPGDDLMVRIAELAGEDAERAILLLDYWKARNGAAKAVRKRLVERLGGVTVALALGFTAIGAPSPSRAAFSADRETVYYGTRRGRRQLGAAAHA